MTQVAGGHPRLVFGAGDVGALRDRAATEEGRAVMARLEALLRAEPTAIDAGFHAAGHGMMHQLTGDASHARRARGLVDQVIADKLLHETKDGPVALWGGDYKMIIRTDPAVGVALAYDLCCDAWDETYRRGIAAALDAKAKQLLRGGGQGWNASLMSNWSANVGAAAGLTAMAAAGDDGAPDAAATLAQAKRKVDGYLEAAVGTRGWVQESWIYYRYPLGHHLLPFLRCYRQAVDGEGYKGGPADWYALLFAHAMSAEPCERYVPMVNGGRAEASNHFRSGEMVMGYALLPPRVRPGALWMMRRRYGLEGDGTFDITLPHHAVFALADWPVGEAAVNPAQVVPRVWEDERKGLCLFRDRWRDGDDFVACFDMCLNTEGGTGRPRCAGGFAVVGLGQRWAVSRTMKRSPRGAFNVVQMDEMAEDASGHRLDFAGEDDGSGVVSVDLSDVYGVEAGQAVRSFAADYSGHCGAPGLFVVADRIEKGGGVWRMHTAGRVEAAEDGFVIETAEEGVDARLVARVIAPASPMMLIEPIEAEGLQRIDIRGRDDTTAVFVVMAVQLGAAPAIEVSGEGLDAAIRMGRRAVRFDGVKIVLD